uniref:PX domain containing serine/threonine kinase n=1 Tax=Oryzias melastigma TaxID=30732 RepID=A0A3B3D1D8_ORYME
VVEDDVCRLLEVENGILGVPSMLRATFSQLRKINTTESIDVFCFGHSLYEMTYGRPPDGVPVDQYPAAPHPSVVSVLESILSTEACKNGMPSVSALIQTPLFSDVRLKQSEKLQIKVPSKLKEALRTAKEKLEKRLQEEQRLLHHHRRLTRAQSHHSSEEEKKRRKILARKVISVLLQVLEPVPLPPPPPPPPPAPPIPERSPTPPQPPPDGAGGARTALLSSIQTFSKGKLKKASTADRSQPVV